MADTTTSIALITKYSTEGFDKVYKQDAISSVLAKDSAFVKFTGAKTVKIANLSFGGLSNYVGNNLGDDRREGASTGFGYQGAQASLRWEERTLRMDRAAKYVIEKFDDEESGGLLIGNALTEINRTKVIPEVDAYCFTELYKNAGKVTSGTYQITSHGTQIYAPLAALNEGITWLGKHEVPDEKIVIFCSYDYLNALRNTEELTKFMQQGDYAKDVSFKMTTYEGKKIIAVPPARFKTNFIFGTDGYSEGTDCKDIDFIVMPIDAAVHVVKFQKTRVLEGDVATAMSNLDGYVLLARIYHDLFVLDNKKVAIYAHTDWFSDSATDVVVKKTETTKGYTTPLATVYLKGSTVVGYSTVPGDKIGNIYYHATSGVTVGTTVVDSSWKALKEGDVVTIASGSKFYFADATGTVVAEAETVEIK
jgi:hypothetical protein